MKGEVTHVRSHCVAPMVGWSVANLHLGALERTLCG